MKKREQVEKKALELYPKTHISTVNQLHKVSRDAYLQCWDDLNEQHNQLREAAKVLSETYKNCTGTVNGGWTEWSKRMEISHKNLEKALK